MFYREYEPFCLLMGEMTTDSLQEQERAAQEQEQREVDIARGNPLLNAQDFNMKRRWDDDVVFKNQARGTEKKEGKEFVNVSPQLIIA